MLKDLTPEEKGQWSEFSKAAVQSGASPKRAAEIADEMIVKLRDRAPAEGREIRRA